MDSTVGSKWEQSKGLFLVRLLGIFMLNLSLLLPLLYITFPKSDFLFKICIVLGPERRPGIGNMVTNSCRSSSPRLRE